jgi:separase
MAVTTLSCEARVDTVLEAASSIDTCSASTLRLLKALLGLTDKLSDTDGDKITVNCAKQRQTTSLAAANSTKKSKTRINAKSTIIGCPEPPIQCLPRNKRLTLATNTFNKTLKNLGDAVKTKQFTSHKKSGGTRSPLKETQGQITGISSVTSKRYAPSEFVRARDTELESNKAQSTPPSFDSPGLLATAECARTSLQCLREFKAEDSATQGQDGVLEHGAMVLISKLQGLGLIASAVEETLNLRMVLQNTLGQRQDSPRTGQKMGNHISYSLLVDCIEFADIGDNEKTFGLVTAFQAQLLHVMAVDDKSSIDDDLLHRLDPANSRSPCHLILNGAEQGFVSAEKAALRLHSLSQSILSICSIPSSSASKNPTSQSPPQARFQLQCLALEIRCHWWRLSNHQPDIEKEIWAPFHRFLVSLCRQVGQAAKSHFQLVKTSLGRLQEALSRSGNPLTSRDPTIRPTSTVMNAIHKMAEATGSVQDSLDLIYGLNGLCNDLSGLQGAIYHCKLANALLLDSSSAIGNLIMSLEAALDVFERPLKGTTTELKDLLLQASKLRKAAAMRLTASNDKLQSPDKGHRRLLSVCIRAVFGVLHFVVRYIGFKPRGKGDPSCLPRSPKHGQCSVLIAQQSLRSALAAVKLNIADEYVDWELCSAALADCLSISKILSETCLDNPDSDRDDENMPTTFVKVSNLFWLWYLKQKDASHCGSDLMTTLNRSIQALEGGTVAEKKIGFHTVKCERAAILCMELRQFEGAYQVLASAINAQIEAGTLLVASQKALTQSPKQIWGEADSAEFGLGRALSTYARLILKRPLNPSSPFLFDKTELQPHERALMLEKQFLALSETVVPENLHARLKRAAETVLSLYNGSAYLPHRLRFVSELLTFCSKNRVRPCQFLPEEALQMCMVESRDESLSSTEGPFSSARSLHSSVLLQWAFQTSAPSVDLLQAFVNSHTLATETCESWTSVLGSINDPAAVMAQIQSVIDFTDMLGLVQIKLAALLLMRRLLELQPGKDTSALTSCTTQIGLQYVCIGLTSQGGRALANAKTLLMQSESKTLIALQWHLAYAEYLTVLCSYEEATDHLVSAQWRYKADFVSDQENECPGTRLAEHKYLAQAAYVASNLAFESGDIESAVLHAKRSVRLSIRQWTVLEKLLGVKSASRTIERSDSKIEGLVDALSNMKLPTDDQPRNLSGKAAAFWAYVQMHSTGLLHLSRLSAHQGSFQDAVFYAEQAKKVGEATGSDVLLCKASSILAAHLAQAGCLDESQLLVDSCASRYEKLDCSIDSLRVSMANASAHLATGEYTRGFEAVEQVNSVISRMQAADSPVSPSEAQTIASVEPVTIKKASRSVGRHASKASKPRLPPTKSVADGRHVDIKNIATEEVISATSASTRVERMQAEAFLLNSCLFMKSGRSEDATHLLGKMAFLSRSSVSDTLYCVLQARLVLADALRLLQSDAVYSVIAESTIAYPTRQKKLAADPRPGEVALRNPTSTTSTKPASSGRKATNKKASSQLGLLKPRELMSKARELLLLCSSSSLPSSSSAVANELSGLLTGVQLLSSIVSPATILSPSQVIYHLNAPKSLRWSRELASIRADVVLGEKSTVFVWPETHNFFEAASACIGHASDYKLQQQELRDNLPSSWTVITLTMSNDETEIFVSKIRGGKSPFVLRLPLDRTASDDLDEETFKFHTARSEMLDIINSANLTAHDAKARSDKQGKKQWWAVREALDARLASLLENMETLWLGGFRGIFSNRSEDEGLLSRFSESLTRTLDRQLPSRRKTGANAEPRFVLNSHVLELFVALGNPDESDLEDAITDLLYFIIDILQFQGEHNAYDEIDFDATVLEVTDALRSYYEAAKDASVERGGHTILILDKALHTFPWESLPCLEGQSVTRMPSLSCLQELLPRLRQNDDLSPGVYIDPRKGAYILNPSSDLTSTQETFLDPFKCTLAGYTSIVNNPPSETEFETCLREKDLCLYFGHGSGAQFIRGRTIKRLKQCAVTFLMGCSSSKMVECGEFEPYGVPYNYLYAGSAAVVGTLWDVTDKDIDRFAMEAFVNWGLLGRDNVKEDPSYRGRKTKARGRAKKQNPNLRGRSTEAKSRRDVSLGESVAKARDACLLRYLNGAAPVVYGIPVYLDQ